MVEKNNESTEPEVEKIAPEILKRINALQEKLNGLLKKPTSPNTLVVRCHGYFREIVQKYSREEFDFAPDDILIDKHGIMSVCLGKSKSPNSVEGDVLWFLSEKDNEPYYLSGNIPNQINRDHILVLVA
jgi:hypothetical protein